MRIFWVLFFSTLLMACGGGDSVNSISIESANSSAESAGSENQNALITDGVNSQSVENVFAPDSIANSAAVVAVAISGEANAYSFSVTVQSADIGCSQYADWWEVIRPDGVLIYRRILTHSHVSEQPFTRSGNQVNLAADEAAIVRVHMNNLGYGGQVFTGSVREGFTSSTLDTSFAQTLEFSEPLPGGCAF